MKKTIVLMLTAFMAFSLVSTAAVSENAEVSSVSDKKPKKAKKQKGEVLEVVFHVHLHCADCVNKATENLSYERGVKGLDVSLENQSITIKFDSSKTSAETLKAAVESLGFQVFPEGHKHEHHHHDH